MIGQVTSTTHSLEVGDLEAGKRWYSAFLGREPDLEPVDGVLEWELCERAWLQVAEGTAGSSSRQMLRLGVEDIGTAVARLARAGIESGGVERIEGVIAFCEFQDPFGNQLSLYQEL